MTEKKRDLVSIACSTFRPELNHLLKERIISFPIRYLPSNMHMVPVELHRKMTILLEEEKRASSRILILYGECHAHMAEMADSSNVVRIRGVNCADILLGKKSYRRFLKERAFFLFPEWTHRWRKVIGRLLDLDHESTIELMREHHKKFLYIDTGIVPLPLEEIAACSRHFGLPYEIFSTSLSPFVEGIEEAMKQLFPIGGNR